MGPPENFTVVGDLTIRGQTREVPLQVTFHGVGSGPTGQTVAGFTAHAIINRKDFGLEWNLPVAAEEALVSPRAHIQMELAAVREDAPASSTL